MVQSYQSPVRVYKYPFEMVMEYSRLLLALVPVYSDGLAGDGGTQSRLVCVTLPPSTACFLGGRRGVVEVAVCQVTGVRNQVGDRFEGH
ncbi:hypothetical protein E2C01_088690 [Portunus trituberculatus]|uniref:Uncharacterized protein n=1 Tax=Portunus trituberculatus TaxID=210409 RepID=A0A5B7JK31_PORTR|nr:hypothetical protein [Portunus trituberculatus]